MKLTVGRHAGTERAPAAYAQCYPDDGETEMSVSKRDHLAELIAEARSFRLCGPSDDPDQQTAVTTGYRYLLVQLKRLASPLLPEAEASRLNALEIDVHDIYTVYEAHAEVDALLPDIEAALDAVHDGALSLGASAWMIERGLLDQLGAAKPTKLGTRVLVRMCQEINQSTLARSPVGRPVVFLILRSH